MGWMWTVTNDGGPRDQRTNGLSNGLWSHNSRGEFNQILGTCQFDLPSGKEAARSKLYRYYRD